jgi:hypothetical protein
MRCRERSAIKMRFSVAWGCLDVILELEVCEVVLYTATREDTRSLSRQSSCSRRGAISSRAWRVSIAHACEAVALPLRLVAMVWCVCYARVAMVWVNALEILEVRGASEACSRSGGSFFN